jgi:hypothetical protein
MPGIRTRVTHPVWIYRTGVRAMFCCNLCLTGPKSRSMEVSTLTNRVYRIKMTQFWG